MTEMTQPRHRILHAVRGRIAATATLLIAFNALAWVWAALAFRGFPLLFGTAFLAYSFGLRHAVDADHIAAIDNITRKLMQEGRRPVTVGLLFSLGHSSVVMLLSLIVAVTAVELQEHFGSLKAIGSIVGTSLSAFFLFAIACANAFISLATWRSLTRVRRGERLAAEDLDALLAGGGLLARLFRGLFRLVERGWHIYALGLLFGLGFETASEIGLLGISAAGASHGLSPWSIMVFPTLFSAGMALVDTADGILMLGAYGWAFLQPVRKLYYNLAITSLSVLVAVLIGGIETLGLIGDQFGLDGGFWSLVAQANENFGMLGFAIIGLFAAGWAASLLLYRSRSYKEMPD
jgi:nickel/cobalt transporter (NiCoT) family protein